MNASLVEFHDFSLYNFIVGNFGAAGVSSNRCPFTSILYCRFVVESPMRKMLYGSFRPPFPFGRCAMRLLSSERKSGLAPRETGMMREPVSEPLAPGSETLASGSEPLASGSEVLASGLEALASSSELGASSAFGDFGSPAAVLIQTNLYSALMSPDRSLLNIALPRSRD